MQAIQSRVRLAERAQADPAARPVLPIRRADAEEALRLGDEPLEFAFDVARAGGGTARTISMAWERSDLEKALRSAEGDELALVFDAAELEQAIAEPDVEAQGLRETAAVLTVAVAAMAGTSGAASAYGPATVGGAAQAAAGASGSGYVVPAGESQALVDDAGAAGASGTGYVVPAGESQALVDDAGAAGASGSGYVVPAGGTEALVRDGASVAASSRDAASLSSTEAAAIGTGAIFLVAAGGFAAARTRRRPDDAELAPA
jgi:hypothetical protein